MSTSSIITVVGSSNTDMVVKTSQLPGPGQTVLGGTFFMNAGGKGANQAVAAARLGGGVTFIAKVGDDIFGARAIEQFKKEGIDCRYIQTDATVASGVALITVDEKGENCIVVAPGANAELNASEVTLAREAIMKADIVLVQLEIPLETVEAVVALASGGGKRVVLNPAPAYGLPVKLLQRISILTPNEKEAEILTGVVVSDKDSAVEAARVLSAQGVGTVIITMGKRGALVWEAGVATHVAAPVVAAIDTTAAGDVFNGALAVGLAERMNLIDAVRFACHAAALSVTRLGAQASAPRRVETEGFMKKMLLLLLFVFVFGFGYAQVRPLPVIFDTDMGPDYDDVGAIALLHAYADNGQARILATMASNKYEGVAAVLNLFNTYFHRPGIPIGVPKGAAVEQRDSQHWTDSILAKYPHTVKRNSEAYDAVKLYRRVLAGQGDHSVVIITVGFLTNLSGLLQSLPDEFSPLGGRELVEKKVKQLVSMAGKFPEGWEFNVFKDSTASRYVVDHWPTPILYSGFEIGVKIKCGLPLVGDATIRNSPVKDVFRISLPQAAEDSSGRSSWDETAVLVGIGGYRPYYSLRQGRMLVAVNGSDRWVDSADGGQAHLVEAMPVEEVQAVINRMMRHQPM